MISNGRKRPVLVLRALCVIVFAANALLKFYFAASDSDGDQRTHILLGILWLTGAALGLVGLVRELRKKPETEIDSH